MHGSLRGVAGGGMLAEHWACLSSVALSLCMYWYLF